MSSLFGYEPAILFSLCITLCIPYVFPMYYLCIPYVFPMYSLCHCPLFSDLSPRSFFHDWSAVSHPSQRAIYLRHVSVTKCPLFSDMSPRSFGHSWSALPPKITRPPSDAILSEPAILFPTGSAVAHQKSHPTARRYLRPRSLSPLGQRFSPKITRPPPDAI